MPDTKMQTILNAAKRYPRIPVAVVDAGEKYILQGVMDAEKVGLIEPILIGRPETISSIANELNLDITNKEIIEAKSGMDASLIGVELVKQKKAYALAKGWIHTDTMMHAVLTQLPSLQRISHVFVTELASYHKLLFITDAAININPGLLTKAAIIDNAVNLARLVGVVMPKVAVLSSVEVVKPAIPSTIDAACLSVMAKRGQIKHAIVDGPLAFDNAISLDSAKTKQIVSEVSGDVDILLAPDIDSANILAKDLEYLAKATMAGIVVGAQVPIMLSSRSDPAESRLLSAALAVLMHYEWDNIK